MDLTSGLALLALIFSASGLTLPGVPSSNATQVISKINQGIQQDISNVQQPIVKNIAKAVFAPCDEIKKLFGVSYKQLDGSKKEPDVNSLTLKYISRDVNVSYNINSAARLISESARRHTDQDTLYIYIHGFTDDPSGPSFGNVSEALYEKGINSVLAVDAGFLIEWLYLRSTTYVRFVGEKMGEVLAALVKNGISAKSIHIIGHSLGAHMASFTGKTFQNLTGSKVARITGLDPAGPCFTQAEPELRLKASDADFVDVIHSNSDLLGIDESVGHVDFYPNGGAEQPRCAVTSGCSHSRAWLLYAESVTNEKAFPAVSCESWDKFKEGKCGNNISYMGFATNNTAHGNYYLQTNGESPYGLGEKGLKYEETSFTKNLAKAIF